MNQEEPTEQDQQLTELLERILDGYTNEDDRARMLALLNDHQGGRERAVEQLVVDGLLGIALESGSRKSSFQKKLAGRLATEEKRSILRRMEGIFLRNRRWVALFLGLLMAVAAWFCLWFSLGNGGAVSDLKAACWTGAVLTLCAVWWVFEPIPIPATSLIPMAIFPLVGVLDEEAIAASYGHHLVILFLSGFMLSRAMERSGAHRRLALGMVTVIGGTGGRRLVLGFMVASAGLSMWISNTATGLMLLPVAIAVIDQCEDRRLATPLLLGVAYAASIGGIATPIGTPANAVFLAQADLLVRDGLMTETPGFFSWMKLGMPVVCIMLPLAWLWLTRGKWPKSQLRMTGSGAWKSSEIRVVIVFSLTALLWITRQDPFGGWSTFFGVPGVRDSTVGLIAVITLFVLPNGDSRGEKLLDWESAGSIPWGILILFGGGIAIGNAFASSGLSQALAQSMSNLSGLPTILMIATVALVVTFLTEVTSNTATATVLMPLLAATAIAADLRPELLMVPAAMSASCAFMLPVATPPNAVVYAVGEFSIKRMAQEGLVLNLLGTIVITVVCYILLR